MGKKSRRKRQKYHASSPNEADVDKPETNITEKRESAEMEVTQSGKKAKAVALNPLNAKLNAFLSSISKTERDHFFSEAHVNPGRRAELWMQQADVGEELVNKYAWAIPNDRAISILKHFSPLVEIGCGANAYWCQQMKHAGIDIVGYDVNPGAGGKIGDKSNGKNQSFHAKKGGPEVLTQARNKGRNLFLCYPDENDQVEGQEEDFSLGLECLENYQGEYVIHVGEIYGDTLSIEQAPWGRSSSPYFQQQLATQFHCILQIPLPNWIHVRDTLTVWKRSSLCSLVFAAEDDDEDDESNEEVTYRYIPPDEMLPSERAAPCVAHLLTSDPTESNYNKKNETRESVVNVGGNVLESKESRRAQEMSAKSVGVSNDISASKSKKKRKSDASVEKIPARPTENSSSKKKKTSIDKTKEKLGYECEW